RRPPIPNEAQQRLEVLRNIYSFERRKYAMVAEPAGRSPTPWRNPLISPVPEYLIRGALDADIDLERALLDIVQRGLPPTEKRGRFPSGQFRISTNIIVDVIANRVEEGRHKGGLSIKVAQLTPYVDWNEVKNGEVVRRRRFATRDLVRSFVCMFYVSERFP